jgi:ATP-binding cassette subfamily B protein
MQRPMTEPSAGDPRASDRSTSDILETLVGEQIVEPRAQDGGDGDFRLYEHLRTPPDRRRLAKLPGLLRGAIRLAWQAGRGPFALSVVLQLVAAIAVAVQLLAVQHFLNELINAQDHGLGFEQVIPALALLVAVSLVGPLANVVQVELSALLGELMARQAAREILDVASAVDLEAYDTPAFHDRLERAQATAQTRPLIAVNGLIGTVGAALGAVGVAVALLAVEPLLLPVVLLSIVPLWWSSAANSRALYRFSVEMTSLDRERNYAARALADKDLAKEVRAFALADYFRDRFESRYASRITRRRQLVAARLRRSILATLISTLLALTCIGLLAWLLLNGDSTPAAAATGVLGIVYLGQRLNAMMSSVSSLYEAALFIEDFTLFLDLHQTDGSVSADAETPPLHDVAVRDVTFTYPGAHRPVLRRVSLDIGAGEIVAVVGANGSGKTTLAKLLAFLYRPDSGEILWDGTSTRGTDPVALRRQLTVVFQDFAQFWISARDNIGAGATERLDDLDGIIDAARSASADALIEALPGGYDTVLSRLFEGGRDLSVGQWQRIALARSFFRDARLLIMDEPTAALDAEAEHDLFRSMRDLCRGRSVLLISHRFSSVREADRIYVLEHGAVVESGTHDELMARAGRYARMFTLQAAAYVSDARRDD